MGRPTRIHEDRKETLDALATLCGFTQDLSGRFPDGCRPDVLRLAVLRRSIFIGEAKATEAASSKEVAVRLLKYMAWLRTATPSSVFALGVGWKDAPAWRILVDELSTGIDLPLSSAEQVDLEDFVCLWWTKMP